MISPSVTRKLSDAFVRWTVVAWPGADPNHPTLRFIGYPMTGDPVNTYSESFDDCVQYALIAIAEREASE